jgi:hypothetical protein
MGGDALAVVGQLLKPPRGMKLGLGAATPSRRTGLGGQRAGLTDRPGQDPPRLGDPVTTIHLAALVVQATSWRSGKSKARVLICLPGRHCCIGGVCVRAARLWV